MENTVIEKYKTLLRICVHRGIALDIIQQIVNLSCLPQADRAVTNLLNKIENIKTETELKMAISQEIINKEY